MLEDYSREDRACDARAELRKAIMVAFCKVLHDSHLPPMTVMELAAEALGSVYCDVADAHRGANACLCGWEPVPEADIGVLRAALALTARPQPFPDLKMLQAAGRA